MRTRLLPILCVLALLLSACTVDGKPSAATASVPVSGPTDETAAPTAPPTESASDGSGSVTPGGWQVYTDPSAYRPAEGALYTRPAGVDLREFHPENANGRVYPYYTDTLYEDIGDGQSWACGHHAGFVDETGTIVTDGVYSSISILFDSLNEYDPYAEGPRLPLWRTGQLESVTVVDEGEYTYPVGAIRYGVVAMDGSFSIPCEYVSIQPFSDRFLCNRSWDKPDFLIFDLSGNVLITSRELYPDNCDWWHVSYAEGLYLLCSGLRDGTTEYRFVDESGTPVLGPYRFANVFHGALAPVSLDGDRTGLIDRTGSWVVEPTYSSISYAPDGCFLAEIDHGSDGAYGIYAVLDPEGREVFRTDGSSWINSVPCGYMLDRPEGEDDVFYDPSGQAIWTGADWTCVDEQTFYVKQNDGVLRIVNAATGAELQTELLDYVEPGVAIRQGEMVRGYQGRNWDTGDFYFIPADLSGIREIEADPTFPLDFYESSSRLTDQVTGDAYYSIFNGHGFELYSEDGDRLTTLQQSWATIYNGRIFEADDELFCTYRSLDGELLFRFPMYSGAD